LRCTTGWRTHAADRRVDARNFPEKWNVICDNASLDMSLLIRNGEIVTPDARYVADIFCEDETITRIAPSIEATPGAEVIDATEVCNRPRWAKLSPNTDRLVEISEAVSTAGAEAVTLVNTLLGLVFDPDTARPVLGNGGGGVSGPAIHPIAVRAVADVRAALPDLPIVGVGGVVNGWGAAELMLAGAQAVQVGTATFANPAAITEIQDQLLAYAASRGLHSVSELTSAGIAPL